MFLTGYTFLSDHEKDSSECQEECKHHTPRSWPLKKSIVFLIILLSFSVAMNLIIAIRWLLDSLHQMKGLDQICSEYTSESSTPIAQDVNIKYSTIQFNGSFSEQNIYRSPPGPKVDEAWRALGTDNRHYIVPEHLGPQYGLSPGLAKLPESDGGGYPVNFEFEHHLHCLNLLRQSSYWNFDYYLALGDGPFVNEEKVLKSHVGHCLDILRQVIMCQPDTGVFGSYWIEETGLPFVDFNTKHKCKNFEALKDWVVEHQASQEEFYRLKVVQRPGDTVLSTVP